MSLLRPKWKSLSRQDGVVAIAGSGGTVDIFNLSDGPGIIKGGGFLIGALANPITDYDLKLTIDGIDLFDFDANLLDVLSANSTTRPWTFTEATTSVTFDFDENANLGFLSTAVFEIQNNNAAGDNISISGGLDYHVGAS